MRWARLTKVNAIAASDDFGRHDAQAIRTQALRRAKKSIAARFDHGGTLSLL